MANIRSATLPTGQVGNAVARRPEGRQSTAAVSGDDSGHVAPDEEQSKRMVSATRDEERRELRERRRKNDIVRHNNMIELKNMEIEKRLREL